LAPLDKYFWLPPLPPPPEKVLSTPMVSVGTDWCFDFTCFRVENTDSQSYVDPNIDISLSAARLTLGYFSIDRLLRNWMVPSLKAGFSWSSSQLSFISNSSETSGDFKTVRHSSKSRYLYYTIKVAKFTTLSLNLASSETRFLLHDIAQGFWAIIPGKLSARTVHLFHLFLCCLFYQHCPVVLMKSS